MTPAELHALPEGTPVIDRRRWPGPLVGKIDRGWFFGTRIVYHDHEWPALHILAGSTSEDELAARIELAHVAA